MINDKYLLTCKHGLLCALYIIQLKYTHSQTSPSLTTGYINCIIGNALFYPHQLNYQDICSKHALVVKKTNIWSELRIESWSCHTTIEDSNTSYLPCAYYITKSDIVSLLEQINNNACT